MRQWSLGGKVLALGMVVSAMATLGGCGAAASPEISAVMKIAQGTMDTLTAAEIQALDTTFLPTLPLTEQEAGVIAEFLSLNKVATIADMEALIQKAETDPTSIQLPAGLLDLFASIDLSSLLTTSAQSTASTGQTCPFTGQSGT
jgi:hypothetical protein